MYVCFVYVYMNICIYFYVRTNSIFSELSFLCGRSDTIEKKIPLRCMKIPPQIKFPAWVGGPED
jgi:hypothetical protein